MEDIKRLNLKLDETYGRYDNNRPIFRIVWADSQVEKRMGTFREFLGPLFLREETKLAERKKYPEIKDRWVLEHQIPIPEVYRYDFDSILLGGYSYEPVWIFNGPGDTYQVPIWDACQELCTLAIYGPEKKLTLTDMIEADEKEFAKAVQKNLEILENDDPIIPNLVHAGEGIFVPSSFERENVS